MALYSDDHAVGPTNAAWLQQSLDLFSSLLARVGLRLNFQKSVVMMCQSGFIHTGLSQIAHHRQISGDGTTFHARQNVHVHCPVCNTRLLKTSLAQHLLAKHHLNTDALAPPCPEFLPSHPIQWYTIVWPSIATTQPCPAGCKYSAPNLVALLHHFRTRPPAGFHPHYPGRTPFPKYPNCLLQARNVQDHSHQCSKDCALHMKLRFQHERFVANYLASSHRFTLLAQPLPKVTTYKYLGCLLTSNDSDWPTLYHNLSKARQQWACIL